MQEPPFDPNATKEIHEALNGTTARLNTHRERVKAMKLRQCLKTLAAAGVTLAELQQYMDETGFKTPEEDRKAKLHSFRTRKRSDVKRVLPKVTTNRGLTKVDKSATVRTVAGNKTPLEL